MTTTPQKHHTIPADVLPSASEDLFYLYQNIHQNVLSEVISSKIGLYLSKFLEFYYISVNLALYPWSTMDIPLFHEHLRGFD